MERKLKGEQEAFRESTAEELHARLEDKITKLQDDLIAKETQRGEDLETIKNLRDTVQTLSEHKRRHEEELSYYGDKWNRMVKKIDEFSKYKLFFKYYHKIFQKILVTQYVSRYKAH